MARSMSDLTIADWIRIRKPHHVNWFAPVLFKRTTAKLSSLTCSPILAMPCGNVSSGTHNNQPPAHCSFIYHILIIIYKPFLFIVFSLTILR